MPNGSEVDWQVLLAKIEDRPDYLAFFLKGRGTTRVHAGGNPEVARQEGDTGLTRAMKGLKLSFEKERGHQHGQGRFPHEHGGFSGNGHPLPF
jgi:hypothetical protein